jgi:dihydroneopterin aldolase
MSDNTMTIHLNDVQFYGYHGLYKEEQKLGNNFIVNLSIDFFPSVNKITAIEETIDYVSVYNIVKQRMQTPTPLLETIVGDIADAIFTQFKLAQKVNIQITKAKVFVNSLNGNMSVSLIKSRSEI